MSDFAHDTAFQVYAVTSAALGFQLLLLALWTGTVRVMRKRWVNPEDARFNKGELTEADHPDVQRVKRAHQNLIENAVPFFGIGLLYVLTGATARGAQIYFCTFLGARVLHSIFYLWGRQPFRTMMFGVGVLATMGMAVQVLMAVL